MIQTYLWSWTLWLFEFPGLNSSDGSSEASVSTCLCGAWDHPCRSGGGAHSLKQNSLWTFHVFIQCILMNNTHPHSLPKCLTVLLLKSISQLHVIIFFLNNPLSLIPATCICGQDVWTSTRAWANLLEATTSQKGDPPSPAAISCQ